MPAPYPRALDTFKRSNFRFAVWLMLSFLFALLVPYVIDTWHKLFHLHLPQLLEYSLYISTSVSDTIDALLYTFFFPPVWRELRSWWRCTSAVNNFCPVCRLSDGIQHCSCGRRSHTCTFVGVLSPVDLL